MLCYIMLCFWADLPEDEADDPKKKVPLGRLAAVGDGKNKW